MTILQGRLEEVINSSIENNENPAVVLIDMQEGVYRFMKDTIHFQDSQQLLRRQQELLSYARQEEMPIFVFELGPYANSTLHKLSSIIWDYTKAFFLTKHFTSAFKKTDFEDRLRKKHISTLLLMGQRTDVCVLGTAQDAHALGFQVITAPTVMDPLILDKYGKLNLPSFYVEYCRTYDDITSI